MKNTPALFKDNHLAVCIAVMATALMAACNTPGKPFEFRSWYAPADTGVKIFSDSVRLSFTPAGLSQ
jgi:hypothetical protein